MGPGGRRRSRLQPLSRTAARGAGRCAGGTLWRAARTVAGRPRQRRGDRSAGARVLPRGPRCDPDPAADVRHVRGVCAGTGCRPRRGAAGGGFHPGRGRRAGSTDRGGETGLHLYAEQSHRPACAARRGRAAGAGAERSRIAGGGRGLCGVRRCRQRGGPDRPLRQPCRVAHLVQGLGAGRCTRRQSAGECRGDRAAAPDHGAVPAATAMRGRGADGAVRLGPGERA